MTTQPPANDKKSKQSNRNPMFIPLQAGCLTFLVAGLTLVLGLWLDARLESFPRWTLILVLGSAPFTLFGVFWLARRSLKRSQEESDSKEGVKHNDDQWQ